MDHLLNRTATTSNITMDYRLTFHRNPNRPDEILGSIDYIFGLDHTAPMSRGTAFRIRATWHRLCRINRARNAGRNHLRIINGPMDPRERRVLGHLA